MVMAFAIASISQGFLMVRSALRWGRRFFTARCGYSRGGEGREAVGVRFRVAGLQAVDVEVQGFKRPAHRQLVEPGGEVLHPGDLLDARQRPGFVRLHAATVPALQVGVRRQDEEGLPHILAPLFGQEHELLRVGQPRAVR
jgi:hypothetical protein